MFEASIFYLLVIELAQRPEVAGCDHRHALRAQTVRVKNPAEDLVLVYNTALR